MGGSPPEDPGASSQKKPRRWWKILLAVVALFLVLVVLTGGLFTWASIRRAFPNVEGSVALSGLRNEVTVVRDSMGIPHIYASDSLDLVFAQGYVHAQERFWQMDFWRHIGAGRLAELFGESQLETDLFLRTLGWERIAEARYRALPEDIRELVDAYAAGVNAYLAERSPAELSFEYTILELLNHGYDPEPWTAVNTLTWPLVLAWDLGGNMDLEIERAMLLGVLPPDRVEQLYPPYPGAHHPYIVPPAETVAVRSSFRRPPVGIRSALERVADRAELVSAIGVPQPGSNVGSNSWAVSGTFTATGSPILANDTHLGIQMPSIWFQMGTHCGPVTDECPYDVTGFGFAGVPGIVIGHNADIAWGFTNMAPDAQDLYIERTDGDRYEVNGEWIDMEVREEVIEVAGGDPVTLRVRSTRHGPIISDVYEPLEDFDDGGVDTPEEYQIALRWTALDVDAGVIEAFIELNQASDWDEFRDALSGFAVPAQNVIYADTLGNIGYQSPGRIPIRAKGDGTLPVPGWTDEYEWTGFIPFDELLRSFNPESGYVATANNAVTDDAYPYLITRDWDRGYRARRVVDLLVSNPGLDLREHGVIQFDGYDLNAERLLPFLLAIDSPLRPVLEAWDLRGDADSAGAAAFAAVWRRVLELTFHDELPEDYWPTGGDRWFLVVSELLDNPNDPFWQIRNFSSIVDRDRILTMALEQAYEDLVDRLGDDPSTWRWGDLHVVTFENPSLGSQGIGVIDRLLNRGPFATSGGEDYPNATGWTPYEGFQVDWVPSQRMLIDLGDFDRSLAIHTTGQSGHVNHDHYDDMIPMWVAGRYAPMPWTREHVDQLGETVQVLTPAG